MHSERCAQNALPGASAIPQVGGESAEERAIRGCSGHFLTLWHPLSKFAFVRFLFSCHDLIYNDISDYEKQLPQGGCR